MRFKYDNEHDDKNNVKIITIDVVIVKKIDHPTLIQEWKLNLDAADYEKNTPRNRYTIKKERN